MAAIPDALFVLDREGRYLDVGPTGTIEHVRARKKLVGRTLHEVFPSDIADRFLETVLQALTSNQVQQLEYWLPLGERRPCYLATVTPAQGETVIWIARDVTEHKRAEKMQEVFTWLGGELSTCETPYQAGEAFLKAADQLFGWDAGFIDVIIEKESGLEQLVAYDVIDGIRQRVGPGTATELGPLTRKTLREGAQLILRDNPQEIPARFGGSRPSASLMFVPIRQGNERLGVASIQSYSPNAYTHKDLEILQAVADYCQGAIQRTLAQARSHRSEVAQERSERLFRALIEHISDAVMLVDRKARGIYINPMATVVLGYSAEEFTALSPFSLIHPADMTRVRGLYTRLLRAPEDAASAQIRVRRKDGSWRWIEAVGKNLLAEPTVEAIIINFRDVTERTQSEKIREVFASLGRELSSARSAREAGQAVLQAAEDLLGWGAAFINLQSKEDVTPYWVIGFDSIDGHRVEVSSDMIHQMPGPLTRRTLEEGAQLILRADHSGPVVPFGDKSRLSASLMFVPLRKRNEPIGVLSVQSYTPNAYSPGDLDLLQALAESERRFRALVENISDVVVLRDAHGMTTYVSPGVTLMLGYSTEEFSRLSLSEIVHPDELGVLTSRLDELLQHAGRTTSVECRLQHHNGSWRWAEVTLQNLIHDSSVGAVVMSFSDITDHKRSESLREAFVSLGGEISRAVTAREAAWAILHAADALFGWDAGFVDVVSEQNPELLHSVVAFDLVDGQRTEVPYSATNKAPGPLTQKAIREGAHLVLRQESDSGNEPPFGNKNRRSASLMFAPIRIGGNPAGIVSVQSYSYNAYTHEDLALLQALADYCGGAFQRTMAEMRSRRSEEERARSERRFRALIENSSDAVLLMDADSQIIYASPSVERITGYTPEEFKRFRGFPLVHPDEAARTSETMKTLLETPDGTVTLELRLRHKNQDWRWIELVAQNQIHDPAVLALVVNFRDVTERKQAEEQLIHGAYHDALTGLPNRIAFLENLGRAFARGGRHTGYGFAILFLDLDRFKVINDSLGHLVGDKLLVQAARRLENCLRSGDVAARLGGDEFAILLEDMTHPEDATRVAERILVEISRPFVIDGSEIFTSTSIGVAMSSTGYKKPEDMLRDADTAMYRAKALGKSRYALFDSAMHQRAVTLLQMETDLRRAVERDELVLHYQPIVGLDTGIVSGFEALVRWQHPKRGLIYPAEFIPIAEETDLIAPIGWWILREACRRMRLWQLRSTAGRRMSINVNLSARQFAQADLLNRIQTVIRETGLDPRCLKLEITESAIIENAEASIQMLGRLKELQIQLHVDDFGTGYSSLAYLHRFPIDALKIDRSFVTNLGRSEEALEISRAIIALARNMGMEAIAEGIESREQLEQLRALGCRLGQGFFFSPPVTADEAEKLIYKVFPV